MKRLFLVSFAGIFMIAASMCWAAIPHMISYQGILTQSDGTSPVPDENYNLTFKIYGSLSDVDSLWWEHHTGVAVTNGLFNVLLGSVNPIPGPVFDDSVTYLGVAVGTDPELTPRARLTSVGYAYHAWAAEIAEVALSAPTGGGWTDDGAVVSLTTTSDSVGIGTTEPSAKLDVRGTLNQGAPGSGESYDVNFYGYQTDYRMFWDASRVALRAGREENNGWHHDSVGTYSFAAGYGTKASGKNSAALGYRTAAEGRSSMAMGQDAKATGDFSVAMGWITYASGQASTAMGRQTVANGENSTAMGYYTRADGEVSTAIGCITEADGDTSIAIGKFVNTDTLNTIVLGTGVDFTRRLVNKIPNSLMIGFNSTIPTVFVDGSSVGIGTTSPDEMLHIENSANAGEAFLHIETSHATNWHETGIRIKTPQNKWHLRMDDDTNNQIPDGALGLRSQDSGVETMTWAENGNVGIGTGASSPTEKLDVNGTARLRVMSTGTGTNVVVDGNGVLMKNASSSLRYKKNIRELDIDPQKVCLLEPVRFEWKSTGEEDIGLIAEDVENVVPDLVIYDNEGKPDAVKYDKIAIYLLEVVKEQQEMISALDKEIAKLKE